MATNLLLQLPSYAYQQYSDDPNIVAFFTAYNGLSQTNLDATNALSLPNYLSKTQALLDWVAASLYGQTRNSLDLGTSTIIGPINTYNYNQEQPNQYQVQFTGSSNLVSDGVFKAILQWNNFKGDGYHFTITWLKDRVQRFLDGNPLNPDNYQVSVTFTGPTAVLITVPAASTYAEALQSAVASGLVLLPFQYEFSVALA